MVQINFAQKNVSAKIVYYGPGMSGKTTNLEVVHQRAPEQNKGDLTSISTDGDRTLFFDFMPLDLGTVAGMRTCFQIYTVPGQVYYNSTRKLVLQGVDGVVFVADSGAGMLQENLDSLRNLEENLNEYGKSLANMPHVIQFNKRDLPDALSVEELNQHLNAYGAPVFEAIANTGQGVFPTLKSLAARVLETIHAGNAGPRSQAAPTPRTNAAPMQAQAPVASQPSAALPRVNAPVNAPTQPAAASAYAAAQPQLVRTGFQPQPIAMHAAQGYPAQAQQPMQSAYPQTAQPAAMPMQPQQLVQTGFHAPVVSTQAPQPMHAPHPTHSPNQTHSPSQYMQQAAQQQAPMQPASQQPPANLHMARAPIPTANAASGASLAAAAGATRKPRTATTKPAAPRANNGPLEGTRFRPRTGNAPAPRAEPRPTPAVGSSKLHVGLFVAAALVVGAGATWAVLKMF